MEAEEKLHLEEEEERVTNLNINLNAISLGGSREDTVSPMASQRTGEKTYQFPFDANLSTLSANPISHPKGHVRRVDISYVVSL